VAVTVVPEVPDGTLNVQLNVPAGADVKEPAVQVVIVTPSKTSPTRLDAEKPVPATTTVAPTGPWPGVTVMAGVVTVNVPPAVLALTSVAVTVVPEVPLGTRNVQLNVPVAPVVREPGVHVVMVTPSKTSPTKLVTEKPVPATVTVAPNGPWAGLTVMAGVVTVNVPVAVFPPTSFAVTVVPDAPTGTLNVQLNAPVASVVNEPLVQVVIALVSKVNEDSAVDTEKPDPATVTVAPMGPCAGVTVIAGVVTVNVPPAV
jgi:hypothetical protein